MSSVRKRWLRLEEGRQLAFRFGRGRLGVSDIETREHARRFCLVRESTSHVDFAVNMVAHHNRCCRCGSGRQIGITRLRRIFILEVGLRFGVGKSVRRG